MNSQTHNIDHKQLNTSPARRRDLPAAAELSTQLPSQMRAVIATGYGASDVLVLAQIERPTPADNEVLVQVVATNVTTADSMMRRGDPPYARLFLGLLRPKARVPGTGFAGHVVAIGAAVRRFQVGDAVLGEAGLHFGAHAEFVRVSEQGVITLKPENMDFETACTLCDGPLTSLNFLQRIAHVQAGQRVLINGAAGSLGSAAVQLAKNARAHVTAVCGPDNAAWMQQLGADVVVDYRRTDFTQQGGDPYDVIYDAVGKSTYAACRQILTTAGQYLSPVLSLRLLMHVMWTSMFGTKSAKFDATGLLPEPELRGLLSKVMDQIAGNSLNIMVERSYDFDEIRAAHDHVDSGHKKGNVVIRMT